MATDECEQDVRREAKRALLATARKLGGDDPHGYLSTLRWEIAPLIEGEQANALWDEAIGELAK